MALISVLVVAVVVSGGTFAFSIGILLQCLSIIIFFLFTPPRTQDTSFTTMMDAYWWALITMTTVSRKCPGPVIHFALDFLYNTCPIIRFFPPVKEKTLSEFGGLGRTTTLAKITKREGGETGKRRQAPTIYFLPPGKSGGGRGKGKAPPPFFGPLFLPLKADGSVGRFCAHISETIFRSWGGEGGGRTIPFVTFCFSVVISPSPPSLQRGISVRNGKGRKRIEGGGGKEGNHRDQCFFHFSSSSVPFLPSWPLSQSFSEIRGKRLFLQNL